MTSLNSSKNKSYYTSPVREKINFSNIVTVVTKSLRRLWPKYDQYLEQLVTGYDNILALIHLSFKEAGFLEKFQSITKERANARISSL